MMLRLAANADGLGPHRETCDTATQKRIQRRCKQMHAKHPARPIGRNQTKARIALVSLGVGIGLDQPTVRETANNAKTQITHVHGHGARLEAMSLQPAFAFFALFAVPFPCFDAIPSAP